MSSASPDSPTPPAGGIAAWRILLRGAGVLLALGVFSFWAAKGYNDGWTKNEVPVTRLDPVTEIEYVEYEKRFVPGLEFLGAGVFAGLLLAGVTFVPARKRG